MFKSVKVVWFPDRSHSEIAFMDSLRYYIGKHDRNGGKRRLSCALNRAEKTPVVVASLPSKSLSFSRVQKIIDDSPPSKINTCMGTVSNLVNRVSEVKIPPIVNQSPELSALYLFAREMVFKDVKIECHGISKSEALKKALVLGSCHLAFIAVSVSMIAKKGIDSVWGG